jgi:hypothetical protein
MRAARSAETTRIRVDPGKLELPVHLHVENSRDLGQVFQAMRSPYPGPSMTALRRFSRSVTRLFASA